MSVFKNFPALLLKVIFAVTSVLMVGLPFQMAWCYLYAVFIVVMLVYTQKNDFFNFKYVFLSAAFFLVSFFIPKIEILEKQRLLVENNRIISSEEFVKNIDSYNFAQTANGFIQGKGDARKVRDINITNCLSSLNSGYVNKPQYNFYGSSDLKRDFLPFVVCYLISDSIIKRGISFKGKLYFNGNFVEKKSLVDIKFVDSDKDKYFYAFSSSDNQIELRLNKTNFDSLFLFLEIFFNLAGIFFMAASCLRFSKKLLDNFEITILISWVVYLFFRFYGKIFTGIVAIGGSDGIVHGGMPYSMLEFLSKGSWLQALKSPEDIFYFMPGMRYVRFFEMLIFGDFYVVQIAMLVFTPVIYYRFLKILLNKKYAFAVCLVMLLGVFNFLGFSFRFHAHYFLMLYGEGFAYSCFLLAVLILFKNKPCNYETFVSFFILFVCVSIRPNLCVFVAFLAFFYLFTNWFIDEKKLYKVFSLGGLLPILLIPLHNYYFGKKLVLLTSAAEVSDNLSLHPKMYFQALMYILLGEIPEFHSLHLNFIKHYNYKGLLVLFFIFCNFVVYFKDRSNKVKALALSCCFGLFTHLFYLPNVRYLHPYFFISIALILYFIKNNKNDIFTKTF